MVSLSDIDGAITVAGLTEAGATLLSKRLIEMTLDLPWRDWDVGNLLCARPEKWQHSLIASRNAAPVGWAIASRKPAGIHLHHIVVAPEERSLGIGTMLLDELIRRSRPDVVSLKVHDSNMSAIRLYRRMGFTESPSVTGSYLELSYESTGADS